MATSTPHNQQKWLPAGLYIDEKPLHGTLHESGHYFRISHSPYERGVSQPFWATTPGSYWFAAESVIITSYTRLMYGKPK